ncbi:MAG: hypothetical protein LBV60_23610 [Streptomyces sp.]|nr:hypothetical protein [Streptomyces sp.]
MTGPHRHNRLQRLPVLERGGRCRLFYVYRNGTKVGSPTGTSFSDSGLSAGTSCQCTVAAADSKGTAGTASAPVTATTRPW